jgi:hypothetical protein
MFQQVKRGKKCTYRPTLESLEDRTVLSPTDPFLLTPVPEGTPLALHIHPHLDLFIDGQAIGIPAGVGLTPNGDLPLHTHDATGTIHVESPILRTFFLQDWFTVWQTTGLGQQVAAEINSALGVVVTDNGQIMPLDSVVLHDHDQIVVYVLSNHPDATTANNETFVTHVYHDLLGRGAEPYGLTLFTTILDQGMSRRQAAQVVANSHERHSLIVSALYADILGRPVDPVGQAWVGFLDGGGTVEQMEADLFGSQEYFNRVGESTEAFLNGLYGQVLHRFVDPASASVWDSALANGTTRAAVAGMVLGSAEAQMVRIAGYYQEFLYRPADPGGMAAFMAAYASGALDETIIATMLASPEYFPLS